MRKVFWVVFFYLLHAICYMLYATLTIPGYWDESRPQTKAEASGSTCANLSGSVTRYYATVAER